MSTETSAELKRLRAACDGVSANISVTGDSRRAAFYWYATDHAVSIIEGLESENAALRSKVEALETEGKRLLGIPDHEYVGMGHCVLCAATLAVVLTEERDALKQQIAEQAGEIERQASVIAKLEEALGDEKREHCPGCLDWHL